MSKSLHEAFTTRMGEFRDRREALEREGGREEDLKDLANEETEYMLNTAPYIREQEHEPDDVDEPETAMADVARVTKRTNKKHVFMKYLYDVENVETPETVFAMTTSQPEWREFVCPCGGRKLTDICSTASHLVCESCGTTSRYDDLSNFSAYTHAEKRDGVTFVNHLAYKRINHFCEWLNSLQGKEGTEIPQDIIEAVRAEFKKTRATTSKDIKPSKVREHLKKLRLTKYYENVHTIANILCGVPSPKLPPELEAKLKELFVEVQTPFETSKPANRKNFLSYSYVLHKFCELLGEDEYLPHFPLLKSPEKLYAQDAIWKKMCAILQWEYIPSI
jgi:hypothetical protein